jgi:pimeloyl-ACP methyl ester carboxylesterase
MERKIRNGVRLAYVEAGRGEPPVLIVHGMQCHHGHMLALMDHLSGRHRVVAVDLRGHGASDKPVSDYSNEEFAEDLLFLCRELGLERPIGIGHSFGGSLLLWLAANRPDVLSGLVLLDSGVRMLATKVGELGSVYTMTKEESRRFLGERLFGRDDPPALKQQVLDEMFSIPDHVIDAMRRTVLGFDSGRAALDIQVPALLLMADKPFTDNETLASLGPLWRTGQVVGAGHFIQLVAPEQVGPMIDRFLAAAGLRSPA